MTTDQAAAMEGRVAILLLPLVWQNTILHFVGADDSIVFPDSGTHTINTQSSLPSASSKLADSKAKDEAKPRFGFNSDGLNTNFDFGIQPNTGGISGSASFSSSYGGQGQNQGQSGSQSQSFNFQAGSNGFSASHAASQASSFNSPGSYGFGFPPVSGSQASSHTASFSGSAGGGLGSAASSQASSFGVQGSGAGFGASSSSANSQSFSSSLGSPDGGYGYYPAGEMSASNSQSAGASFGGTGSYPSENLPPDFMRYFQHGYKNMNNYGRRNCPEWSDQAYSVDRKNVIACPQ